MDESEIFAGGKVLRTGDKANFEDGREVRFVGYDVVYNGPVWEDECLYQRRYEDKLTLANQRVNELEVELNSVKSIVKYVTVSAKDLVAVIKRSRRNGEGGEVTP
jgi:hypothetical protein